MACEKVIRSYVRNHLLQKYQDVDEDDAITCIVLLIESGLLDPSELLVARKMFKRLLTCNARKLEERLPNLLSFRSNGPHRKRGTIRKRITHLRISSRGPDMTGIRDWNFHSEKVYACLSHLEYLQYLDLGDIGNSSLVEIISRFPSLKELFVAKGATVGTMEVLQGMGRPSNLEYLHLGFSILNEDKLATFLLDFLPFLPNLTRFGVYHNDVKSLQKIAERIRINSNNEFRKANNSRLRFLDLGYQFHGWFPRHRNDRKPRNVLERYAQLRTNEDLVEDEAVKIQFSKRIRETEALKTILDAFPELNEVKGLFSDSPLRKNCGFELDPGIAYLLDINFAGRILIKPPQRTRKEQRHDAGSSTPTTSTTSRSPLIHSHLPFSIWPTVLARTTSKADGIYYLLRNSEVLFEKARIKM